MTVPTSKDERFKPKSLLEEVGKVGLVLSFIGSEVTLSSATLFLSKLFGLPGFEELRPILDILLTSAPLTVAIAVMFVYYKENKLTFSRAFWALTFAIVASMVLNLIFDLGMPNVPINTQFGWFGVAPSFIFHFLQLYGPFPFIKSCFLGYFFGKWFVHLQMITSKLEHVADKPDEHKDTAPP